jgi:hypothetical protein
VNCWAATAEKPEGEGKDRMRQFRAACDCFAADKVSVEYDQRRRY